MKKRTKKIFTIVILTLLIIFMCVMLVGCSNKKEELTDIYPELNECYLIDSNKDDVLNMLNHGSGIVFFSWKECPWCHRYISYVNEVCKKYNIQGLYYDIYQDREDNTEFYQKIIDILQTELEDTDAYDSDGKLKIFVPDVVFISNGKIIGHDNSSSMESDFENNANFYWNQVTPSGLTRENELMKSFNSWGRQVCESICEKNKKGCNGSCSISE